jgi:hypothetical protein
MKQIIRVETDNKSEHNNFITVLLCYNLPFSFSLSLSCTSWLVFIAVAMMLIKTVSST